MIHPIRVLDCANRFESAAIVIDGIEWALKNLQTPAVANVSLLSDSLFAPLDEAVQKLIDAGVVTAVAAGNNNQDACTDTSPARLPDAITVASTDNDCRLSAFSNKGSCVDIAAPGSAVRSASSSSDTGFTVMSGTSMATPHVAGVAAILLEGGPNLTPSQTTRLLIDKATKNIIVKKSPEDFFSGLTFIAGSILSVNFVPQKLGVLNDLRVANPPDIAHLMADRGDHTELLCFCFWRSRAYSFTL